MLYYAGIGSRETPELILKMMTLIAQGFAAKGWCLRSGAALGADAAFELGAGASKEIFLPWAGYNNHLSQYVTPCHEAKKMAALYHPNWPAVKQGGQKLHGRNCHIMLGPQLKRAVSLVVCWTKDGQPTGGTGQALRMCPDYNIPVYNLYYPKNIKILCDWAGIPLLTEHTWKTCDCGRNTCYICGGGLGICTVCNGAEGSLTTECCGRLITAEEEDRIYKQGNLDFIGGQWINKPNHKGM